jgi:hypothetical protein
MNLNPHVGHRSPCAPFVSTIIESGRLFADGDAEEWLEDPAVGEIASEIEREVVSTGRLDRDTVERFLDVDQEDRNRFAILQGLDLAFQQVDFVSGTIDAGGLTDLVLRYIETGRLTTDDAPGVVLPKYAVPGQDHAVPQTLRDAASSSSSRCRSTTSRTRTSTRARARETPSVRPDWALSASTR